MTVQKIIIDCDPGIDDALALAFAAGHPELDLRGITTVAGNVGLDKTTANALRVRDFVGMPDVPVLAGCPRPLLRPPLHARDVHGDSGLGAASIPEASSGPADGHAVDFLASATAAEPGQITLIAIGPLTNVALALRRYPELVSQVRNFVIMGGSAGRGNVTPAAEFNIAADPEAAAIVFGAGWTVTMVGLDVTLQARATAAVRDRMRGLGRLADELVLPSLAGYRNVSRGPGSESGGGAGRARRVRRGQRGRTGAADLPARAGGGGDGRAVDVGHDRHRLQRSGRRVQRARRRFHRRRRVLGSGP